MSAVAQKQSHIRPRPRSRLPSPTPSTQRAGQPKFPREGLEAREVGLDDIAWLLRGLLHHGVQKWHHLSVPHLLSIYTGHSTTLRSRRTRLTGGCAEYPGLYEGGWRRPAIYISHSVADMSSSRAACMVDPTRLADSALAANQPPK